MFFVYLIKNLINGNLYVGKTVNVAQRWKRHKLVSKRHYPGQYHYLHSAISKYGADNFSITTLFSCNEEQQAFAFEKAYIAQLKNEGNKLYNLTDGGEGMSGNVPSDAARKNMSLAQLGNKNALGSVRSDETRLKLSIAKIGTKASEATRNKLSLLLKGNKRTLGTKQSDEAKRKIGAANKGKKLSEETKHKISLAKRGKPRSTETKKKISLSLKKR